MNDFNDLPFGIVAVLLLAGLGIFLVTRTQKHAATVGIQQRLFLIALAARFALSLAIYETSLGRVLGDEDSSGWANGAGLMQEWVKKGVTIIDLPGVLLGAFQGHHQGYKFLTGGLFYLTGGPARLAAAALNCFFGAITVVFIYRIARALFPERVAYWAGWMACLAPSLIIWSSQTVKEPIVIMIEVIALYCCVQLRANGFSIKYLLFCGLAVIIVIPFRFYASYLVGGAVLLSLAIPQFGKRKLNFVTGAVLAAMVLGLMMGTGLFAQQEADLQRIDMEKVAAFRRNVSEGSFGARSGVKMSYDMTTTSGFVMGTAVGSVYFLLSPFPWQLLSGGGSMRMLLTAPEVFAWWWVFFFGVLPGLWWLIKNRFGDIQPLLFFTLGLLLLYSAMFGNVGLAYRQRAQLLPFLLIFAAVGLELRWRKREALSQQQQAVHMQNAPAFARVTP